MKKLPKWLRIALAASFLPAALWLGLGLYGMVFGMTWFMEKYTGLDGFWLGLLTGGVIIYAFPALIAVLTICLVIQIVYVVQWIKLKRSGELSAEFSQKLRKFMKIAGICAAVFAVVLLVWSNKFYIDRAFQKHAARKMMSKADLTLTYNEKEIYVGGILGFEDYECNTIFVDTDTMTVGFLTHSSIDEYNEFQLKKADGSGELDEIKRELPLQTVAEMNDGSRFITFTEPDLTNNGRTQAILIETSDGSSYFTNDMKMKDTGWNFYSGLSWYDCLPGENLRYADLSGGVANEK